MSLSELYNKYFSSTAVYSYREDERIFRTRFTRTWFVILIILVAVTFLGSLAGIGANEYHYFIGSLILINLISAIGLQLLVGFTGLLSIGHAAFMGVGAYTSALLVTGWGVHLFYPSWPPAWWPRCWGWLSAFPPCASRAFI